MVGYGSNEGDGEEIGFGKTWTGLCTRVAKGQGGVEIKSMIDLNVWIGDRERAGITVAFGVPGENDNGRRVVGFAKKGNSLWVTHIISTEVCISTQEWQGVETMWRLKAL